jgi:dTDP-4-amino-4,6-dideoxygalactose transaminase
MTPAVPFNDLGRYATRIADRLAEATRRVIDSGWFLLGPETEQFEATFATACASAHGIGVANGTDALELALRSVGCGPGDEVLMVANAGMYAATAALAIGATPVFVDVDPATLLIQPAPAAALAGPRTRAAVATHLYGNVVDVEGLRAVLRPDVAVVEDCAQAHGATLRARPVGSLGDVAAFSFYPTKNLGALGDAGMVVTGDDRIADRARALRQYGWTSRYYSTLPGGRNSRIDEIQAAVLLAVLPDLAERNARRVAIQARYQDELGDRLAFVATTPGAEPVAHLCVARHPDRDALVAGLGAAGVAAAVHYPIADHEQPALDARPFRQGSLTVTEQACREVISLPCFPDLTDDEVSQVIAAVGACT